MMNECGPCTWFVTMSPGEWMWPELGDYIKEVDGLTNDKRSISALVAADPVAATIFIHNRFDAVMEYLLSPDHPIGEISHFYWVCEYQGRGLPHFHCLFWIKNAPVYGVNSNEEVQEFITKHITCEIPNKTVSPELHDQILMFQSHKCNSYCMRTRTTKSGSKSACRFGFPRPVTKDFVFRDVDESIANRRKLKNRSKFYDLPRNDSQKYINDWMPAVAIVWKGKTDAQFISEK